jgi:hypothetical protein
MPQPLLPEPNSFEDEVATENLKRAKISKYKHFIVSGVLSSGIRRSQVKFTAVSEEYSVYIFSMIEYARR